MTGDAIRLARNAAGLRLLATRILGPVLLLLFLIASGRAQGVTSPPPQAEPKNLLFLLSYGYGGKGVEVFNDSFRDTLTDAGVSISNLYFEYLDLERNKADPGYRQRMLELLRRKYAQRRIDLVLTGQQPALNFLLNEGREIAPGAPAITVLAPTPSVAEAGGRRIISHSASFDIRGTLNHALELFPETRRIVFASGSSEADRKLAASAEASAAPWQGKVEFEFTHDLSLDDMLKRLASLPPASLIIYTQFNRDVHGRVMIAYEVERMIVKAANAPVFGFYDFNLYNGGLGGSVLGVRNLGASTAQLALDVLNGKQDLSQPVSVVTSEPISMFDWTQIRRWGGDPKRLSGNPVFLNHVPTFWEQYRSYVIGLILFIASQTVLIVGLLMNRRRWRVAEQTLRESLQNLDITLNSIGDAVIATDAEGRVRRMNPVAERLSGWALPEAHGKALAEVFRIVNAETREKVPDPVELVIAEGTVVGLANHTVLLARDGREYQIADSAAPIRNAAGDVLGVVLVFSDVTEKYRAEAALRDSEQRYRMIFVNSPLGIFRSSLDGRFLEVNPAMVKMLGYDSANAVIGEISDLRAQVFIGREDQPSLAVERTGRVDTTQYLNRYRRKDGSEFIANLYLTTIRDADGKPVYYEGILEDFTERKQAADQIQHMAFYDGLTDLPNRRLMLDRLGKAISSCARRERQGALLLIDLDNFKSLNDTAGHDVGDQLLLEAATRLEGSVRQGDTVARLGGDEFVVILDDLDADEQTAIHAEGVARKIMASLERPYILDVPLAGMGSSKRTHHCTSSIGITLFRDDSISVDELMRRADTAMYQAKAAGRNTLRFFDPELQNAMQARATLEIEMRKALVEGQFVVYYQAQVDASGALVGAEALARWLHPVRGLISPAEFIPLAEDTGMIVPLGQQVLEMACRQLAAWARRPETTHLTIAVNVSPRQFSRSDLVAQVMSAIENTGAPAGKLKLELTESLLLDNAEDVVAKMAELKAQGVSFSLDDFGTGYSSLTYLKRLPIDQLKIDQSFVRDILTEPNDAAIARTVVALGQSLGMSVIAEGVETAAQRDFLANSGCLAYQGYFFGRPLPQPQFEDHHRLCAA